MKIVPVVDVKAKFSAYIKECREEPVVVTKNGKPVAVLLSIEEDDDELERLLLTRSQKFKSILDSSKQEIQDGQGISHDMFWQELNNG